MRLIDLAPTVLDLVGVASACGIRRPIDRVFGSVRLQPDRRERCAGPPTSRRWTRTSRATGRRSPAVATRDYKLIDLPNAGALRSAARSARDDQPLRARRRARANARGAAARHRRRRLQSRGSSGEKTTLERGRAPAAAGARLRRVERRRRARASTPAPTIRRRLIGPANDAQPRARGVQRADRAARAMAAVRDDHARRIRRSRRASGIYASMQREHRRSAAARSRRSRPWSAAASPTRA